MSSSYQSEIGQTLKNAREDLRVSLRAASEELYIRAHYLKALEEGNLEELPGAAYVKGYLQAYAVFLHLDKDEILRRFDLVERKMPSRSLFFPKVFSEEKSPSLLIIWGGFILVVVSYMTWYFMFRPSTTNISIVDTPPAMAYYSDESRADSLLNMPCALEPTIYPPCYYKIEDDLVKYYQFLPQNNMNASVMELYEQN
ncbi:MAG: helix-turn-helix domain-containing protein [Rickettsiales bacterium]